MPLGIVQHGSPGEEMTSGRERDLTDNAMTLTLTLSEMSSI